VLDTDTIEVAWVWGTNKVRLVGLDAPESKDNKKLHDQAKLLRVDAGQLLSISGVITRQMESGLVGRNVNLIFPRVKIERDAFSRLLAYVEVDGKDIGAMLLRNGLVYPRPEPHPRQATYQALNAEARENRKGIYGLQR
jgi:micrococcal nuclease